MVTISGSNLNIAGLHLVADRHEPVTIDATALERVDAAHTTLLRLAASGKPIYGVNTGFGPLKDKRINAEKLVELQLNLVRSHAAGIGDPMSEKYVRGAMLLLANCLAHGNSGIDRDTLVLITESLNHRIHPIVPAKGSLGASGDLAPLAHVALALIGEGEVEFLGEIRRSADVLQQLGLQPATLGPKAGLALINGTHFLTAVGGLTVRMADLLIATADVAVAMHVEASLSSAHPFDEAVHELRPHEGQRITAFQLRGMLAGSLLVASHTGCHEVQDAYSVRCAPQIHGAVRDAHRRAQDALEIEMNSVTDNPLLIGEEFVSAGNFHGEPCALVMDYLTLALVELGNVSERRTERLLNPTLNRGLPAFLAHEPGLESGLMIAHYAAAAVASENRSLAHPPSADNIPTGANQEDHNSMGMTSAWRLAQVTENLVQILAVEILCSARALRLRMNQTGLEPAEASLNALRRTEQAVPLLEGDAPAAPWIREVAALVRSGEIYTAAVVL